MTDFPSPRSVFPCMKLGILLSFSSLLVSAVALAEPPKTSPVPSAVATLRRPILRCPDPAAAAIDFSITARSSRFAGRVRIVGTVKNVGTAPYESGPNQQIALLYELPQGGTPRLVGRKAFQNLAPGEAVAVEFQRAWNASSPAEGEFPPAYKLLISYDPDIRLDANPKNDDCNATNNVRERLGSGINELFR